MAAEGTINLMPSYPDANYIPLLALLYQLGLQKVVPMIEEYEMHQIQMQYLEIQYEMQQEEHMKEEHELSKHDKR